MGCNYWFYDDNQFSDAIALQRIFILSILGKNDGFKRFLKAFFIVMFALLPVGLLNYLFIKNSGELFRAEEIVSKQSVTKQLYGSALSDYPYGYKLAIFEAKRPDVVVVGSSERYKCEKIF